jgi:hypothetical protein
MTLVLHTAPRPGARLPHSPFAESGHRNISRAQENPALLPMPAGRITEKSGGIGVA